MSHIIVAMFLQRKKSEEKIAVKIKTRGVWINNRYFLECEWHDIQEILNNYERIKTFSIRSN